MNKHDAPWFQFYNGVPRTLSYPGGSMYDALSEAAAKYPRNIAYSFMGIKTGFKEFIGQIDEAATALMAIGVKPGERVTVCLPNAPQAVVLFYAINKMGGVANMIHPLSSEGEIAFYLNDSNSVAAVTLDQFYEKFERVRAQTPQLKHLILTGVGDALSGVLKIGYALTEGRKVKKPPRDADVLWWKAFLSASESLEDPVFPSVRADDAAVILYSGGTTGTTKGILLSNKNFNALALQTAAAGQCVVPGNRILSVMPVFHGFGLGIGIHTMLLAGCTCILVPRFNAQTYGELIKKERPNYIAGVPTLYEAMLRNPAMDDADLSCLMGVFSGGDSLSIELKKRFDVFLKEHGAKVQIREGYGTTECVTASCLTPCDMNREGSIGIPFPDTFYKIVRVGTEEELPYGEEGEICLSGPTVMLGYNNQPEETKNTLKTHGDGEVWLHTGDLGMMDQDGFIYFRQRIKRMIVTSGYNVYPSQLENIIDAHESVMMSCVVGVKDPLKMQKVKAFVMLKPGFEESPALLESIRAHCQKNIAKYAMPYEIEVRKELPKTLVGKVAYRQLEEEENAKESGAD